MCKSTGTSLMTIINAQFSSNSFFIKTRLHYKLESKCKVKFCIHRNVEMAYQNYTKKITDRGPSVSLHKGVQLRALLPQKTTNSIVLRWSEGLQGACNWAPMLPRNARLSDSCTSDRCCFSLCRIIGDMLPR